MVAMATQRCQVKIHGVACIWSCPLARFHPGPCEFPPGARGVLELDPDVQIERAETILAMAEAGTFINPHIATWIAVCPFCHHDDEHVARFHSDADQWDMVNVVCLCSSCERLFVLLDEECGQYRPPPAGFDEAMSMLLAEFGDDRPGDR
jgi:hypothetical protein